MNESTRQETVGTFGRGMRPAEGVIAIYLLWTVLFLPFFHRGVENWDRLVLINLLLMAALVAVGRFPRIDNRLLAVGRRLLPLVFIPILYSEVKDLNDMFFPQTYFDSVVIVWEKALFGGNVLPLVLHQWLPWRPLSEYLHFAYLAYYVVIPTPFVALALTRQWKHLERYLTALMLVFVVCQLWFIAFPVAGPFHYYPEPDPYSMGRIFPPLVHSILHGGSSVGTAFPSSHCAVAATCWIVVLLWEKRAAWFLAFIVPALTVGTVYGGFHYGVDALAGWLLALILLPVSFSLHRRWEERRWAGGSGFSPSVSSAADRN